MKSLLLAASVTLPLLTGDPAQAADMPVKQPMSKPPVVYSWTGLYFGGHVGTGWANNDWKPIDFPLILCNSKADRFGTIAGRFGIAADRALVYLKGGAAWLHSTHVFTIATLGDGDFTASGTKWGWTAGAGVEYALTRNWSAKLEYDFMDFGTSRFIFGTVVPIDIKQNIQTVKFGLNYKFDWGGVVAASY